MFFKAPPYDLRIPNPNNYDFSTRVGMLCFHAWMTSIMLPNAMQFKGDVPWSYASAHHFQACATCFTCGQLLVNCLCTWFVRAKSSHIAYQVYPKSSSERREYGIGLKTAQQDESTECTSTIQTTDKTEFLLRMKTIIQAGVPACP